MSRQVTVFTRPGCPYCEAATSALAAAGVAFVELDPTSNSDALRELLSCSASAVVPTIVIDDQVLVGFDAAGLHDALREREVVPPEDEDDVADELSDSHDVLTENR